MTYKTIVTILETNMEVKWEFDITSHGSAGVSPSLSYPGDPPEPAEFDIESLGLAFQRQDTDVALEIPVWLKDLLATHLYESDDVNQIVQQADQDCGSDFYDYE